MLAFLCGVLAGAVVGASLGLFLAALFAAAKAADEQMLLAEPTPLARKNAEDAAREAMGWVE